jgi:hypothetical protein
VADARPDIDRHLYQDSCVQRHADGHDFANLYRDSDFNPHDHAVVLPGLNPYRRGYIDRDSNQAADFDSDAQSESLAAIHSNRDPDPDSNTGPDPNFYRNRLSHEHTDYCSD